MEKMKAIEKRIMEELESADKEYMYIRDLVDKIKTQLHVIGIDAITLYCNEYNDNDTVDWEKVEKLDWGISPYIIKNCYGYNKEWEIDTIIRKVKVKYDTVLFDIEDWYEDYKDNCESRGYWKNQTLDNVLYSCDKKKVGNVLFDLVSEYLTNEQLIELNLSR